MNQPKSVNNKKGANGKKKLQKARSKGTLQPSQIISNITWNHTFRFSSSGAFTSPITVFNIFGVAGSIGIIAGPPGFGQVSCIASSFKINYVELWGMTGASGSTLSIDWVGGVNSPNKEYSDTTLSTAFPAHLRCKPPKLSIAAFWQRPNVAPMFTLTSTSSTVIDLNLSIIMNDTNVVPTAFNPVLTVIVLGVQYYGYLDGIGGPGALVPVSLNPVR